MKGFLKGAVVGSLIGGVIVALTTPKTGEEVRVIIKTEGEKAQDATIDKVNEFKVVGLEKAEELKSVGLEKAEELKTVGLEKAGELKVGANKFANKTADSISNLKSSYDNSSKDKNIEDIINSDDTENIGIDAKINDLKKSL